MLKIKQAYLPEEVGYFTAPEKEIKLGEKIIKVFPAFPYEPKDQSTGVHVIKTNWWKNYINRGIKLDKITYPNDSITNIQVISFQNHNDNVGGSFRVLVKYPDKNLLIEIKEETFIEAMKKFGVKRNGILKGEYQFIKIVNKFSYLKLVRVGSQPYLNMEIYNQNLNKSKIKQSQLIPGEVFKTSENKSVIFCGYFRTILTNSPYEGIMLFHFSDKQNDLDDISGFKIQKSCTLLKHEGKKIKFTEKHLEKIRVHYISEYKAQLQGGNKWIIKHFANKNEMFFNITSLKEFKTVFDPEKYELLS